MSITNACGAIASRSKPSASGPVGFGAWNVPSASHRSCHASSIRSASAAL